jgi:hypothetical protein
MSSLVPLTPQMLPDLHKLVVEGLSARAPLEDTQRVFFGHNWTRDGLRGYGLLEGGKLVGMLGLIFSERSFGGQTISYCNLHSWYVHPDYRAKSLMMLRAVLGLPGCVLTDFTAARRAVTIVQRLGFQIVDQAAWVLPALDFRDTGHPAVQEVTDANQHILAELSPEQWQLFFDHQPFACKCALIRDEQTFGTIIYSRVKMGARSYCQVYYVSSPPLLAKHHAEVRTHLLRQTGERFVAIDARLMGDTRIPHSRRAKATTKLVRTGSPLPAPVDSLYSEVVLLKPSTLLTPRQKLVSFADHYVPRSVLRMLGRT